MNWPLMQENINKEDIYRLTCFLGSGPPALKISSNEPPERTIPRLTNGDQVSAFESEFAQWLGTKYAVMVNSGASANLITIAAMQFEGKAEIIVPTICWVSDIAAVLHAGYTPVFVDIDPRTLSMDPAQIFSKINSYTRAVFVTHALGFCALDWSTINRLRALGIHIIEDCCEATGATMGGHKLADRATTDFVIPRKVGTFGIASNFSFYYAHHMSTIEGGMVCTDSEDLYRRLRQLRSHGLRRERGVPSPSEPGLDDEFIFDYAAFNVRSTEINAVIGRSQLKRLDKNNELRTQNLQTWLSHLDPDRYFTDYLVEGSSNYALPLVLREPDVELMPEVIACMKENGVEYRLGTAGGGNQLRQPYLRKMFGNEYEKYQKTEHVHFFGMYIGNYPSLDSQLIVNLCENLNAL